VERVTLSPLEVAKGHQREQNAFDALICERPALAQTASFKALVA
jgi:hypothetical protein